MPADTRTFYAALGVDLPAWLDLNASVRCFADPDAHQQEDRHPSCSISIHTGAWKCHGCGAHGGAYDAALARGHSPRSAIDLMIACGLTEPRQPPYSRTPSTAPIQRVPNRLTSVAPRRLAASDVDVYRWGSALDADNALVRRLMLERAWSPQALEELEIGFDGDRITVPIRNADRQLQGVLRYDPFGRRNPKMLALRGTQLGLIPNPARDRREQVVLVEGPPDMIAARSAGIAAIAVPGAAAWRSEWAQQLRGRRVTVVMDCDAPGRYAARQIAADLQQTASSVALVDLDPSRDDGYDITDRIRERRPLLRQRSGLRPIAWPLAVLLEHVGTDHSTLPSTQEARS